MTFFVLAFVIGGLAQLVKDLNSNSIDAPMWTYRPSIGKAAFVFISWPLRAVLEGPRTVRGFVFGVFAGLSQLTLFTLFAWGIWKLAGVITATYVIKLGLALLLWAVLTPLLPLIAIPLSMVTLVLALPVDFLFSLFEKKKENRTD